jgi:hypothetical protein
MTGSQDERYWFRPRPYGWGARPITWEGWLFVVALFVFLIGCYIHVRNTPHSPAAYLGWLAFIVVIAFAAIAFAKKKTNAPWRFRWGRWRA